MCINTRIHQIQVTINTVWLLTVSLLYHKGVRHHKSHKNYSIVVSAVDFKRNLTEYLKKSKRYIFNTIYNFISLFIYLDFLE